MLKKGEFQRQGWESESVKGYFGEFESAISRFQVIVKR